MKRKSIHYIAFNNYSKPIKIPRIFQITMYFFFFFLAIYSKYKYEVTDKFKVL